MTKLTHENFIKARDYIFANSDDINRSWFRYSFEDGDTNAFINVLAKYQHDNGGFGGLFYEFDYQGSCLKCTEVAIGYILSLKERPFADHPVIKNMMKYILERYHPEIGNWGEIAEPEVNDGVYNHWVRYRGAAITPIENEDERIAKYDANEKVCFAAFVALYSELVPEELYRDIIKYPIEYILRYWDKNSPEYNKEIFDDGFIDDSKILKSNLSHLEKEREKLEARSHRLYDDYSDGIIDKELYISRSALLKKELEAVKDKIAKIKIEMRQFKKVQTVTDDYADRFKKYETVSEITRELLVDLVDRITVDKAFNPNGSRKQQPKYVKIIFKFADEHKALISFITENSQQCEDVRLVAL